MTYTTYGAGLDASARSASNPTSEPVRKDAYGNTVPPPGTPEFDEWWRKNMEAQAAGGDIGVRQDLANRDNARALDTARTSATSGFSDAVAGMDQSVLAPTGTTRAPTVAESLAKMTTTNPGLGAQTQSGFGVVRNSPLQVSQASRDTARAKAAGAMGGIDMGGGLVKNPSKVETAADQATDALGPAPRVDQGLADRRLGEYQEALGMSREVIDRLLNGPSTADRIGSQVLRNQLALARSAAGGPGAVAAAFRQAQQQAPELQAAAQQQAAAEELQRVTAAGNVASNFAQAALGARGQDVDIAKKNTDAGIAVKGMIAQLTGTQLELDQRNQELLGQMARDMAAMEFDWAQLSVTQQNDALDRYLQQYGIDQNIAAQIKVAQMSGKMTLKDWINAGVGALGAGASIGAAA